MRKIKLFVNVLDGNALISGAKEAVSRVSQFHIRESGIALEPLFFTFLAILRLQMLLKVHNLS